MTDLFVVWTPASLVGAVIGGLLLGFVVVARFENPRFSALESVGGMIFIGILAGATFWLPQIVDTYNAQGPAFAWRVISRFGLWCLFILAMGFGTGLGVRIERGSWR
jgi:hypothetical protein